MKQHSQNLAAVRGRSVPAAGALIAIAAAACTATNPDEQAKTAADHASYVENTRCAGVEEGPEVSEVLNGKSVTAVRPLYSSMESAKSDAHEELRGAIVTVSAQPGMTAQWLDRVLECHSAAETLGQRADNRDPFYLPDAVVDIAVQPAQDGFAINVSTLSPANAQRILDRANAWAPQRPPAVSSR
jgi:hypothetical protein